MIKNKKNCGKPGEKLNDLKEIPQDANICIFGDDELTSEAVRFIKRHRPDVNVSEKSGQRLITSLTNGGNAFDIEKEAGFCDFVILCTGEIDILEECVAKVGFENYKIFDYGIFDKKINWFHILFKFAPMLLLVCLLWLIQVVLLSPFLFLANFLHSHKFEEHEEHEEAFDKTKVKIKDIAIQKGKYDRLFGIVSSEISDFEQLSYISRVVYGCPNKLAEFSYIYGISLGKYPPARWSIFKNSVKNIFSVTKELKPKALELGAGCFREAYELSKLGFEVDAVQLDCQAIDTYMNHYDWEALSGPPKLITSSIDKIAMTKKYDLITAFNVLEHILELDVHLEVIGELLKDDGCFFVSVPNKKSLCETIWYKQHLELRKNNSIDRTGKSHVHFLTPDEWKYLFEKHDFNIVSHEMGVGFIGYDLFWAIYSMLSQKFFEFSIRRLTCFFNIKYIPNSFERIFYPGWLLNLTCRLDILLKPFFYDRWGTNHFILKKQKRKV
ncbi:class I SAM-dependent methyltransferase [Desulfobacula phenolica]|uniref:Methyltransferase domain-containing protein n=1 Tax=Desulfobacula phenolica TaxID=90732 RepID=A0A1H2DRU4_9BACT|nr:class I SAM-dependent methyltransferase [Desulfobacula phenolica]SDT85504.1 Methyltransferase domain-containing protein [Desulfobacula phenolica]